MLLSGWIREPEVLEGHGAWVEVGHGDGSIHLFGFRPQFRGWPQETFHLVFRAAMLSDAEHVGGDAPAEALSLP